MRQAWVESRRTRRWAFWGLWVAWAVFGAPGNLIRTALREPMTYATPAYLFSLVVTLLAGMLSVWLVVSIASLALIGLRGLIRKARV